MRGKAWPPPRHTGQRRREVTDDRGWRGGRPGRAGPAVVWTVGGLPGPGQSLWKMGFQDCRREDGKETETARPYQRHSVATKGGSLRIGAQAPCSRRGSGALGEAGAPRSEGEWETATGGWS